MIQLLSGYQGKEPAAAGTATGEAAPSTSLIPTTYSSSTTTKPPPTLPSLPFPLLLSSPFPKQCGNPLSEVWILFTVVATWQSVAYFSLY